MKIRITKWLDDEEGDAVDVIMTSDDGVNWSAAGQGATARDLHDALHVGAHGAIRVDFVEGAPDPWQLAQALPMLDQSGMSIMRDVPTGDPAIDSILDDGGIPVIIDGERWGFFSDSDLDDGSAGFWAPCEPPYDEGTPAVIRTRRRIASISVIEEGSRTSGWYSWSVEEIDDELVCFIADLDEEGRSVKLQQRGSRTDAQLVDELTSVIGWETADRAFRAALSRDGAWDGCADELDPEGSSSCKISVSVTMAAEDEE